jgi:kynurenine formamidase
MSKVLDLSVVVDRSTQAPPVAKGRPVEITHHRRGPGHWQVSSVDMLLHTGSHVDSTWHVFEDGDPIAATPLERVIGDAAIIDCSSVGPRQPVDAAMLDEQARDVREGDIIVIRTDWTDRAWGQFPRFYSESPYLTEDGADWLIDRSPKAIVFDFFEEYSAALVDFTSEDFVVHRKLLGVGLPLVEQATNLASVGQERFTIHAPFFKLDAAEAAPCRVFAILDT